MTPMNWHLATYTLLSFSLKQIISLRICRILLENYPVQIYSLSWISRKLLLFKIDQKTWTGLSCSNLLIVLNIEKVVTVPKLTIKFKVFRWIMGQVFNQQNLHNLTAFLTSMRGVSRVKGIKYLAPWIFSVFSFSLHSAQESAPSYLNRQSLISIPRDSHA